MQLLFQLEKRAKSFLFFVFAFCAAYLVKSSFIVGSYHAFFSGINCVASLACEFIGNIGGSIFLLLPCLVSIISGKGLILSFCRIPSLFASFYWTTNSKLYKVLVPFICIILFVVHPVGRQAWLYSMYWIIPIALVFLSSKNIFYKAFGTTFVAHAIGSVLWVYFVPMTSAMFISLIPLVLVERLLFASGMILVYKTYSSIKMFLPKFSFFTSKGEHSFIR